MSEMTNPDGSRNMERDRDFAKKHAGHWCCQGGWGEMAAIAFYWLAECENLRGERDKLLHELNECRHNHNRDHERTLSAEIERDHARAALKKCGEALEQCKTIAGERLCEGDEGAWYSIEAIARAALAADTPRGADLRTQALEEAAGVCEGYWDGTDGAPMMQAAMDIRSLAATPRGLDGCPRCGRTDSIHINLPLRECRACGNKWLPTPQEGTGEPDDGTFLAVMGTCASEGTEYPELRCPECGPVTKHDEDGCCLMCGIDLFHDDDGNLTIQTPEVYKAHGFSIPEDTEEPEPPEHLRPYLATEPPTLSAAEQEHADRVAVEIERGRKGEGDADK
jgi:hypothetical protein